MATTDTKYVLGSDEPEIARLDAQAGSIAAATDTLLRAAGIGGGMRVLDLGTGLGHVAFLVAALLEDGGSVLGVDREERLLEIAERRRAAAGHANVAFVRGDARTFSPEEPLDAIVERLMLFHMPDREAVLERQIEALAPGGTMLLVEFDIGVLRAEPDAPLVSAAHEWMEAAFRSVGADPRIGARAGELLRGTGFADVSTFGLVPYLGPRDPTGPILCAGIIRSLAPQILSEGIATEAELGLDTLQERIAEQIAARDATILLPAVVGAWGRRP